MASVRLTLVAWIALEMATGCSRVASSVIREKADRASEWVCDLNWHRGISERVAAVQVDRSTEPPSAALIVYNDDEGEDGPGRDSVIRLYEGSRTPQRFEIKKLPPVTSGVPRISVFPHERLLFFAEGSEPLLTGDTVSHPVALLDEAPRVFRGLEYETFDLKSLMPKHFKRLDDIVMPRLKSVSTEGGALHGNARGDLVYAWFPNRKRRHDVYVAKRCEDGGQVNLMRPWTLWGINAAYHNGAKSSVASSLSDSSCDALLVLALAEGGAGTTRVQSKVVLWRADGSTEALNLETTAHQQVGKPSLGGLTGNATGVLRATVPVSSVYLGEGPTTLFEFDVAGDAPKGGRLVGRESVWSYSGHRISMVSSYPGAARWLRTHRDATCAQNTRSNCGDFVPPAMRGRARYLDGGAVAWRDDEGTATWLWCPSPEVAFREERVTSEALDVVLDQGRDRVAIATDKLNRPSVSRKQTLPFPRGRLSGADTSQCRAYQSVGGCADALSVSITCDPSWDITEYLLAELRVRRMNDAAQAGQLRLLGDQALDPSCLPDDVSYGSPVSEALGLGPSSGFGDARLVYAGFGGHGEVDVGGSVDDDESARDWLRAAHNIVPFPKSVNEYLGDVIGSQLTSARRRGCFGSAIRSVEMTCPHPALSQSRP